MTEIPEALRRAKQAVEDELLKKPGVVGVDIGYKIVGGQPTNQLAIRVHVQDKRDDVSDEHRIPRQIDDYPTDVLQRRYVLHDAGKPIDATAAKPTDAGATKPVDAEATKPGDTAAEKTAVRLDTGLYDPLIGGISIGPCREIDGHSFVGTLGAIVQDRQSGAPLLLSNYHVLALDKDGRPGDAISQPGRPDGGVCPQSVVGTLVRSSRGGEVDCAVVAPSRGMAGWVAELGPINGVAKPALGQRVRKRGRTTGVTYGTIDTVDLTQQISFGDELVTLKNQINVMPDSTRNPQFGAHGDSGAVLVTDDNTIVGLYMAGDAPSGNGIANPIASVFSALDVELFTGMSAGPPPPCAPPPCAAPPCAAPPPPCAPPPCAAPPPPCAPPPCAAPPPPPCAPPPCAAPPCAAPAPCLPTIPPERNIA